MDIINDTMYIFAGVGSIFGFLGSVAEFIVDDIKINLEEKFNGKKDRWV